MKLKNLILLFFPILIVGQNINLNNDFNNQLIRHSVLANEINTDLSFNVRPLNVHSFTEVLGNQYKTILSNSSNTIQKKVWKSLTKIKYGDTCSYQEIAVSINNSNAVRAVGSACRLNPIPLIIPCHRVLSSDGSIGKYAFGIKNKRKLLKLESYES